MSDRPLFQRAFLSAAQIVVELLGTVQKPLLRDGNSFNRWNWTPANKEILDLWHNVESSENNRLDSEGHEKIKFDSVEEFILVVQKWVDFVATVSWKKDLIFDTIYFLFEICNIIDLSQFLSRARVQTKWPSTNVSGSLKNFNFFLKSQKRTENVINEHSIDSISTSENPGR